MNEYRPQPSRESSKVSLVSSADGGVESIEMSRVFSRTESTISAISGIAASCTGIVGLGEKFLLQDLTYRKNLKNTESLSVRALASFVKGMIGAGLLSMPLAFSNGGLWMSVAMCIPIAIINLDCLHMLLQASRVLCAKNGISGLDYAEVMEAAFRFGPFDFLRRHSLVGKYMVNASLFVGQLGICSIYFVFMAENLKQVVEFYAPAVDLSQQLYIALVLPAVILLSLIKELKWIAPFAGVANLIYLVGVGIILHYVLSDLPPITGLPAVGSMSTLPLYFGTLMIAFEGIPLVLPMENKMERRKDLTQWNGVLNTGFVSVVCLYLSVGFLGYIRFGSEAAGSITLNLPSDNVVYQTVKLAFVFAIFVSYAVQFYVPMQIVLKQIQRRFKEKALIAEKLNRLPISIETMTEYGAKIGMVLITFLFAEAIPQLGLFMSFVGSLITSLIAIIFPAMLEMLTLPAESRGRLNWRLWKDVFYCIAGVVGCVAGVYASVRDIVASFGTD